MSSSSQYFNKLKSDLSTCNSITCISNKINNYKKNIKKSITPNQKRILFHNRLIKFIRDRKAFFRNKLIKSGLKPRDPEYSNIVNMMNSYNKHYVKIVDSMNIVIKQDPSANFESYENFTSIPTTSPVTDVSQCGQGNAPLPSDCRYILTNGVCYIACDTGNAFTNYCQLEMGCSEYGPCNSWWECTRPTEGAYNCGEGPNANGDVMCNYIAPLTAEEVAAEFLGINTDGILPENCADLRMMIVMLNDDNNNLITQINTILAADEAKIASEEASCEGVFKDALTGLITVGGKLALAGESFTNVDPTTTSITPTTTSNINNICTDNFVVNALEIYELTYQNTKDNLLIAQNSTDSYQCTETETVLGYVATGLSLIASFF